MIDFRTVALAIVIALSVHGAAPVEAQVQECDSEHTYLGNSVKDKRPGWHEDVQGISHDDSHWYISDIDTLWKIPVTANLSAEPPPQGSFPHSRPPYVRCDTAPQHPWADSIPVPCAGIPQELRDLKHNHFGDITWQGGYLFVPVEMSGDPPKPPFSPIPYYDKPNAVIAVFGEDLDFVGYGELPQTGAGWVAVGPNSRLYVSTGSGQDQRIEIWDVDWDLLDQGEVELTYHSDLLMRDEGGDFLYLRSLQGGAFSDDGSLLYLINGYLQGEEWQIPLEGIHVFEVTLREPGPDCEEDDEDCQSVAYRVERSTNGQKPFDYEFHPNRYKWEEPEGLTYWDLDAPGAPVPGTKLSSGRPISGQLHALMLDNDITSSDEVYLKHYRADVSCEPILQIAASPNVIDFGDVAVGEALRLGVRVYNAGRDDLVLEGYRLEDRNLAFFVEPPGKLPTLLPAGTTTAFFVTFHPLEGGDVADTLIIESNDPNLPELPVLLSGHGLSVAEQGEDLLDLFDEIHGSGELEGLGSGSSAENRRMALRAMLDEARMLIDAGDELEGCGPLHAALIHSDGEPRPGDFVIGDGVVDLAEAVADLRANMGCPIPGRWSCGLGFELVFVVPLLAACRRRSWRRGL